RLRPVNTWPNSGKPEFGCKRGREYTEGGEGADRVRGMITSILREVVAPSADAYLVGAGLLAARTWHGVVCTNEKPRARGRARAARQRAAGGAQPVQGRGAAVVGLARALHHRRRRRGAGDRLYARRPPARDQRSLRRDRRGGRPRKPAARR